MTTRLGHNDHSNGCLTKMGQIEFIASAGYTFTAALRNPYAGYASLATGLTVTQITPGVYRCVTGSVTGIVFVECVAGALRVVGFANLGKPGDNGYSEVFDTLQEAESLSDVPVVPPTPSDPGDTVSTETIAVAGAGPLSISVDGLTVTQRPMSDQIAADRHVAANNATTPIKGFGLRFARVRPGSAVGE